MNLEEILRLLPEKDRKLMVDIKRNIRQMKIFNCCDIIYWLEEPFSKGQTTLASVPITLSKELGQDLWTNDISFLLTSGTIAVDGDFNYIKNELGMKQVRKDRIIEISKGTPFNFEENCLLYVAENMEYPDYDNPKYIANITDEVERLIRASNGHGLVLFTSYKPLRLVYQNLNERIMEIPLFQMTRGRSDAINAFRASGKGVLFATGSMWEGVNIPGDILSHLIICYVKLPFPIPDPISEYEKTCYSSIDDYLNSVLIPQMLIKLKQGAGRLIRNETDTDIISILDSRAGANGRYHEVVLVALPKCSITSDIQEIKQFLRLMKDKTYFE
ncbi:ATP-dependent DNA helicase [Clostridium formicaceticum]|uniref:ATP-dependent DNA helicase n=1 Tax=Clostridium formicaceticum TaxID=1497 RepID=UPI0012EA1444|nr:ATP-dependent DNA helicase [Clostridium formicaceticum]